MLWMLMACFGSGPSQAPLDRAAQVAEVQAALADVRREAADGHHAAALASWDRAWDAYEAVRPAETTLHDDYQWSRLHERLEKRRDPNQLLDTVLAQLPQE